MDPFVIPSFNGNASNVAHVMVTILVGLLILSSSEKQKQSRRKPIAHCSEIEAALGQPLHKGAGDDL